VFAARREIGAIHVAEAMERYMADLVNATRIPTEFGPDLPRWIEIGASLALDRCGRAHAGWKAETTSIPRTCARSRQTSCASG
jgi:MoxR-like ATPase